MAQYVDFNSMYLFSVCFLCFKLCPSQESGSTSLEIKPLVFYQHGEGAQQTVRGDQGIQLFLYGLSTNPYIFDPICTPFLFSEVPEIPKPF